MNGAEEILSQLRDIHVPAAPSFWPLAPGWWLLLFVVLALTAWLLFRKPARLRKKIRQEVWSQLEQAEQQYRDSGDAQAFVAQLSILLRRVALLDNERRKVASLTGAAWLSFLDDGRENGEFLHGAGQLLATAPYQAVTEMEMDQVTGLVRRWLREHV